MRSGLNNVTTTRTFEIALIDRNVEVFGGIESGATDDFGIIIEVKQTEPGAPVASGEYIFLSFTGGFQGADIDSLDVSRGIETVANVIYLDLDNLHDVLGIRSIESLYMIDAGRGGAVDIIEGFSLNPEVSSALIAGDVRTSRGTAIADVTVMGTTSGLFDLTDAAGHYALALPIGLNETVVPCKDGWTFSPASRSYTPVTTSLNAENYAGVLVYDVDPPVTGDDFVGVGDLSRFAISWQQPVPPNHPNDFDCDGVAGVGDFSFLVTAWLRSVIDPTIVFPPCRRCSGFPGPSRSVSLQTQLVAVEAPTPKEQVASLPESAKEIRVGRVYFVEMWVRHSDGTGPGVSSAYVNIAFAKDRTKAGTLIPSGLFSTLADGFVEDAGVRNLGGSTLRAGLGTGGNWAKVATVEFYAGAPGRVSYTLSESTIGFAAYGLGRVPWSGMKKNGADIDPFFLALGYPAAYAARYPNCEPMNGDINGEGRLDSGDIDPFFAGLGGSCP